MLERTKEIASLVRDIGLIIGVPTIITVGMSIYDLQGKANEAHIKALEAQNTVLKETQFDRSVALLKSQKELYEMDREATQKQLQALKNDAEHSNTQLSQLETLIKSDRDCNFRILAHLTGILGELPKPAHNVGPSMDAHIKEVYNIIAETANSICGPVTPLP